MNKNNPDRISGILDPRILTLLSYCSILVSHPSLSFHVLPLAFNIGSLAPMLPSLSHYCDYPLHFKCELNNGWGSGKSQNSYLLWNFFWTSGAHSNVWDAQGPPHLFAILSNCLSFIKVFRLPLWQEYQNWLLTSGATWIAGKILLNWLRWWFIL